MGLYDYVMIFILGACLVLFAMACAVGLIKVITMVFKRRGEE